MPTSLNKYLDPAALDETIVNIRELIEGLEAEMQDLPYARPDGLYPDMTVGAVIGADETAQWATRESTGSGAATVRSVQGAAVAWNQYVPLFNASSMWNQTYYATGEILNNGHSFKMTSNTSTSTIKAKDTLANRVPIPSGHTWYIACTVDATNMTVGAPFGFYNSDNIVFRITTEAGKAARYSGIGTVTSTNQIMLSIRLANATPQGEYAIFSDFIAIDLTQMFGSGNEPATVAEFEAMYPASYYPYSAPILKPVRIAGIASTDAQGGELDAIEWTAQTLRAAGSVADMLYSDHVETKVALVDLGTFTWESCESTSAGFFIAGAGGRFINEITCIGYANRKSLPSWNVWPDMQIAINVSEGSTTTPSGNAGVGSIIIKDMSATGMTAAQFKEHVNGIIAFIGYNAANTTTTPISPALPMTYRVEQGGSESIIVPDGEISAAPLITIAEPVNAGDEFARIWEAIQSLGYTRNTAQLSRPVSLTDIGSIDEVQKDTADVAEIETIKEVTE